MKSLLITLTVVIGLVVNAQDQAKKLQKIELTNTSWQTNVSCFEQQTTDQYELYTYDRQLDVQLWGYFIHFTDSTFSTSYSAPCGNDCFTSVNGSYEYVKGNQIKVFVLDIHRNGFCSAKSEEVNRSYGVFTISKTKEGLRLVKN